jgi:hypothetical protein
MRCDGWRWRRIGAGVPLDAPSQEGLKWLMVGGVIVAGKAALHRAPLHHMGRKEPWKSIALETKALDSTELSTPA